MEINPKILVVWLAMSSASEVGENKVNMASNVGEKIEPWRSSVRGRHGLVEKVIAIF